MAGSQQLAMASRSEEEQGMMMMIAIGDQWEVQYSRFFHSPSLSSSAHHHPSLSPLSYTRRSKGSWISSSSSSVAYLKLNTGHSNSDSILSVTFRHQILEEHYISKLHFTWPQVSCVSGYPPRGSRVIILSYKDHVGQIQKFAVRFLTIYETERFINSLKEILENGKVGGLACSNSIAEPSSQSEFNPFREPVYRPTRDWSPMTSAETLSQQLPPSLNHEISQNSNSQDSMHKGVGANLSAFPPSFSSLLMQCHPAPQQEPAVAEDVNLKMEITKYLEDSSFQDMLSKVEKVISEIGADMLL